VPTTFLDKNDQSNVNMKALFYINNLREITFSQVII
jgi:hypothetical protein